MSDLFPNLPKTNPAPAWRKAIDPSERRGHLSKKTTSSGNLTLVALVSIAILLLTAMSVRYIHKNNENADKRHFAVLKEKLRGEIVRRVGVYQYGLMGTRSVFAASNHVDRDEFRRIVASRDMPTEFPAATGMGYIDRVAAEDLDAYLAEVRADRYPDFDIRMLADAVTHPDLFVIKYIEPAAQNHQAIGLDIGQESRRRAAAELAMTTGKVSITEQITLVQATGDGPGFLILLPHYRKDAEVQTPEQRQAALEGWVYMTILAEQIFAGASDLIDRELGFKVFDSDTPTLDRLLYCDRSGLDNADTLDLDHLQGSKRFHEIVPVEIGGRRWSVAMSSTADFHAASSQGMWITAIGGCVLTVLLALLLHIQASSLKRARALARRMTADLRQAAMTDRLTGLPNRSAVIEKIQDAIHRAQRVQNYHYAVLFLDFDRFKVINDSLGHGAGDDLLRQISQRLNHSLRPHDAAVNASADLNTAARIGGDEFIILLDGLTQADDATAVAQRLLDVLAESYEVGNRQISSTASIGVAMGSPYYKHAEKIIRDADTAMYEAKDAGRGGYMVFDRAMRNRAKERLNIENDLHKALGDNQFYLVYQPILSLKNNTVSSCEALVRWQHPERGMITPDQFVRLAEEIGLIVPLGQWVLNEAIGQFARWRAEGQIPDEACLSVNLSRKQLVLPDLFDVVCETLSRHRLPAPRLHLEVTENEIMSQPEVALKNLQKLRRMGIQIDIDDFGTGHSSLACLHEFPIDVLKIDRAFVANLAKDPSLKTVLQTVTELATRLDVRVVAEGVETPEQLALLRELGCDYGQGFLFSPPVPAELFPERCRKLSDPSFEHAA